MPGLDPPRLSDGGSVVYTSPYPEVGIPDVALTSWVLARASRLGDKPALVDGTTGETIGYQTLLDRVQGAAALLRRHGVEVGDVIALVAHNQPSWAVAYYGAVAAGAAVTPLNPMLTTGEMQTQLAASRASILVADPALMDKARPAASRAGTPYVLSLEELSGAPPAPPGETRRLAQGTSLDPRTSLAALPYSSGTTGLPKGVMLTHRNLVANLVQHEGVYPVASDDVFLAVLPFFHIYGLSIILNVGVRQGATVVTLPRFDLDRWLEAIERHRVTWLHVAPPMVVALAARQGASEHDLSSVRHAVSGAAPLDAETARRAEAIIGCRIGQGYGMTEASPGTHFVPSDQVDAVPAGSVGYLLPNTEARLVAIDSAANATNAGELWVRGPQVMAGYLDDPAATAAALDPDGWLRTGDVVRIEHGVFFVVDRVKELIKYKGYQVPPAELEALLLTHDAVADAAVVAVPDAAAGEIPKAFVVARSALDPEALMAWVAERVAPYKRIRAVELVDVLPKSPSGKILRRVLAPREAKASGAG